MDEETKFSMYQLSAKNHCKNDANDDYSMVVVHRSLLYFPLDASIPSVSNKKSDILTPLNLGALIFSCSGS